MMCWVPLKCVVTANMLYCNCNCNCYKRSYLKFPSRRRHYVACNTRVHLYVYIYLHICCCVCITRSNVAVFGVCMTHCKDIKISTGCMCFRSLLASCCMRRPLWPRFRSENTLTIRRAYLHVTLKLAAGRESRWRHATLCLDADTCSHWYKPLSTLKWQWRSFLDGWVKRLRNTAVLAVCGEFIKVYTINPRNRFYGSKTTTKPDWMGLAEKWSE